jgi:predicted transcriptional regulator
LIALVLIGDSLPITIADQIDAHPRSVSRSIQGLVDDGYVVEKDRSVYSLTPEGFREGRALIRRRGGD